MKKKVNLKIILVGDQAVGKTSLIKKFVQNRYIPSYKPTIGADFFTKEVVIDDQIVSLQCWDTAGQEKYVALSTSFYRGANCCVLVYDITDAKSFNNLPEWKERFLAHCECKNPDVFPFLVLGNKLDLENDRKVGRDKGEKWCKAKQDLPFFETSALTGNLDVVFRRVAEIALANYRGVIPHVKLDPKQPSLPSPKKCSC